MGRTTRNSSGANRRSLYKRTSISRTPDELVKRRVAINDSLRKKHREQLITAKRFRNLTRHEEYESAGEEEPLSERNEHDEDISPYYRLSNDQVESLASDLKNEDKNARLEAAQYIGKFVLEPAQALIDYITKGDCIDTLAKMIVSNDAEERIQAAQTISNIAAGPYDLWLKSVSVVPQLITHLSSDDMNLREVCAGALGNMAAEDLGDVSDEADKVRARIRDSGAILPLVKMLDSNEARSIQSACFALANLARGPEDQLEGFLSSGITEKLYKHLTSDIATDTATELCWVVCYLTAGSSKFREEIFLSKGFVHRLVQDLVSLANQNTLVIPVLRTIGNLVGSSDEPEYLKLLVEQDSFLSTVVDLVKSDQRSVKKEALWVLSKVTSTQDSEVIRDLEKLSIIESLSDLVGRGAFDIRKGAAYCIMNIAHHGQEHLDKLPHKQLLPAFFELIKSQEADMIKLGLDYIELLLTQSPKGKEIVDSVPETMDVLASVAPAPDPELFTRANKLVDQYYGEKE